MTADHFAILISLLALAISAISLSLHLRKHWQDQNDRQPEISVTCGESEEMPSGWYSLTVNVRNLDRYSLNVDSVSVSWPIGVKLAHLMDCYPTDSEQPWKVGPFTPPHNLERRLEVHMKVPPAGGEQGRLDLVTTGMFGGRPKRVYLRLRSASPSFKLRNRLLVALRI